MPHVTPKFPPLRDEGWLRSQYVDAQRSTYDIAAALGCSPGLVMQALLRFDIPRRGRHHGRWKPKTCRRCSATFTPSGPGQLYCPTKACRYGTQTCGGCGREFVSDWQRRPEAQGFCSRRCWYASKPHAPMVTAQGYVRVWVGKGVPGARPDGRILEHRLVAQQVLGRPLRRDETVHHINGRRADNRPENLQVRTGRHGAGVAAACGDCGSRNVVHIAIN